MIFFWLRGDLWLTPLGGMVWLAEGVGFPLQPVWVFSGLRRELERVT